MIARGLLAIFFVAFLLTAQDFDDMKVERVLAGYRFVEGPAWSRDGFLVLCDVHANKMIKWVPGQKPETYREDTNGACGSAFDIQGRLYICESRTRRVVRLDKLGKVEVLADRFEGKRLNAPNDIVVRRDGNTYFTDPAFGAQSDSRELNFYGVYRIAPKGELEVIAKPHGRPNGVALSANGRTLYVTNSDERNVRAYDLDKAGAASNERVVLTGIDGVPDGIRLDEKNNMYIAARHVNIFSPSGQPLHTVELSEKPSNLAFGDADLSTLYITARTSVYRVRVGIKGAVQHQ
jgi:gluconolactonase